MRLPDRGPLMRRPRMAWASAIALGVLLVHLLAGPAVLVLAQGSVSAPGASAVVGEPGASAPVTSAAAVASAAPVGSTAPVPVATPETNAGCVAAPPPAAPA